MVQHSAHFSQDFYIFETRLKDMSDPGIHKALDKTTFEQLFRTHFAALCSYAMNYLKDSDNAKEIVHEVFINLWEKRESIDPDKPVKSYLYTSVYNRCMNHIRDNKKFAKLDISLARVDEQEMVEDHNHHDELDKKIQDTIAGLPEKCREVFMLSRFEELKYNEIAEKLGISVKTVEAQMSKALKVLRESLTEFITILLLIIYMKL